MEAEARRIPTGKDVFLDHVGAFVGDHKAAARILRRLGFTLTPFARHVNAGPDGSQQPSGTGNQCVMFQEGYLEVLSVTGEDTPLAAQLHAALQRYEGLHLIAFAVSDAEERHADLPSRGFRPLPLVRLRRPIPGLGDEHSGRFDVVRVPPGAMPEGRIQLVTHHTPESVWRPNLLTHANGAEALSGILVCVEDPAEVAIRFSRFIDGQALFIDPGRSEVELERGRLTFVRSRVLKGMLPEVEPPCVPYMVAIGLRCQNADRVVRCLQSSEIPFVHERGRIVVMPKDAFGVSVIFHDRGTTPWS